MKQPKPSARHTVLLIGEGKTEQAFFKHLKSLYIFRGCGVAVKIHTAKGKGPEYIVNYAVRRSRRFESERILTLWIQILQLKTAFASRQTNTIFNWLNPNLVLKDCCSQCLVNPCLEQVNNASNNVEKFSPPR